MQKNYVLEPTFCDNKAMVKASTVNRTNEVDVITFDSSESSESNI